MAETDWAGLLQEEDVEGLWNALYRLISRHPAVRPLRFATDEAAVTSQLEINADLTQEVFLELFQKQRFDHYLTNDYTSTEIENEITHIELPNLVGARLRKRYPESFRMARRVSSLLKSSSSFRRFTGGSGRRPGPVAGKRNAASNNGAVAAGNGTGAPDVDADEYDFEDPEEPAAGPAPRRQRMVNQIYGLRKWPASKRIGDSGHFSELAKSVPIRRRDTRVVGRTGSSQLILSNPDLEVLIVEIFSAIDSPADVKTVRQLALSKIPLQDYAVASLDEDYGSGDGVASSTRPGGSSGPAKKHARAYAISSNGGTPETELLDQEQRRATENLAEDFLNKLRRSVNNNAQRYHRLMRTLWFCYYDPEEPSQLEIAKKLGVSDSLVSDNRKLIEYELKKLKLSIEDGPVFSEALKRLVKVMSNE
jgi:hypothetical protein